MTRDTKYDLETQSDDETIPPLVARNVETESNDGTIPFLLDNSIQQDSFDECYGISNQIMLDNKDHNHPT